MYYDKIDKWSINQHPVKHEVKVIYPRFKAVTNCVYLVAIVNETRDTPV